jgi:hypothetical protein
MENIEIALKLTRKIKPPINQLVDFPLVLFLENIRTANDEERKAKVPTVIIAGWMID